jgi:hypothetical protein
MVQRLNQVLELSDNGRVREHQIDTLSVIADDTEQEIPAIIKCGDVFRVSQCHCQQRVFGERVIVVEMPEQGSRFVPEGGKQVDIIDGARISLLRASSAEAGRLRRGRLVGVVSLNMIISIMIDFKG